MKRLPMRKIRDVLRLSAEGLSTRQMASSLAIGRTTLQGYLDRAHEAGLSWPLPAEMSDSELERLLYPRTAREAARRAFQPDWAYVHRELRRKGVTLRLLWEEYRAAHPDGYGYSRFVSARFLPQRLIVDAGDDVGLSDEVFEEAVPCLNGHSC